MEFLRRARSLAEAAWIAAVIYAAYIVWMLSGRGLLDPLRRPVGTDFVLYYAASLVARAGDPAAAYTSHLHAAELAAVGGGADPGYWPWTYPPHAFFAVYPLAGVPYLLGYAMAMAIGSAALAWIVASTLPGRRVRIALSIAAPAFFLVVAHGQMTLLVAALLGAGLVFLRSSPVLAGILIGVASVKPHLGLLFPVALISGRHWRAVAAAGATVAVLVGSSCLAFGADTARAWIGAFPMARFVIEDGATDYVKQASVFAAVRELGGSVSLGYGVQLAVALAAAGCVAWAWRPCLDWRLQNAVLLSAAVLASPHVMSYDHLLVVLAMAWFAATWQAQPARPSEGLGVAAAWLAPFLNLTVHLPVASAATAALCVMIVLRGARLRRAGAKEPRVAVVPA